MLKTRSKQGSQFEPDPFGRKQRDRRHIGARTYVRTSPFGLSLDSPFSLPGSGASSLKQSDSVWRIKIQLFTALYRNINSTANLPVNMIRCERKCPVNFRDDHRGTETHHADWQQSQPRLCLHWRGASLYCIEVLRACLWNTLGFVLVRE